MEPRVGIVIVNWNKASELGKLLDSLVSLDYNNHEIFVVDNASTDNSIEITKNHFLHPTLLVNKTNRGGTGGFNSGIHFALQAENFDYLWLLDNDATVTPQALYKMIKVMESDPDIGLAGSRIMNLADPEFIVETGAFLDWKNGTVQPVHRNSKKTDVGAESSILVDYVAVCSALARVSALSNVGLMDERYFLFWDDMDWGIAFQEAGYKVVGVPASEVFHAAFTEYRSVVVDSYYGVRNQLITFSKYRHHKDAPIGMFHLLRRVAKNSLLTILSGTPGGGLSFLGYWDFLRGNFGKIPWSLPQIDKQKKTMTVTIPRESKILLIPTKDVNHTEKVVSSLLKKGFKQIDILIQKDRENLFERCTSCRLIIVDYTSRNVMWESIVAFFKIFFSGYNISIKSSADKISPFTYAVRKNFVFDQKEGHFVATNEGLANIWRIFLSVILGEALGCIMFFFAWIKSFLR